MIKCCDNLELLKIIDDNSIDLIYCDVLFNTGRNFEDYIDPKEHPRSAAFKYHIRLMEMRRVLKQTGNIYIHCDYNISHYMKIELDDIFGLKHFENEIIWSFNSPGSSEKRFSKRHNTIFRYSKSKDCYFVPIREPYLLSAPRGYAKEKCYHPEGKIKGDVWEINILGQNDKTERTGYSTQKPKELLIPIILSSCPPNGIVADFYCGSGTTLVVAKQLNRKYIGCDINYKAIELTLQRLNNV